MPVVQTVLHGKNVDALNVEELRPFRSAEFIMNKNNLTEMLDKSESEAQKIRERRRSECKKRRF